MLLLFLELLMWTRIVQIHQTCQKRNSANISLSLKSENIYEENLFFSKEEKLLQNAPKSEIKYETVLFAKVKFLLKFSSGQVYVPVFANLPRKSYKISKIFRAEPGIN